MSDTIRLFGNTELRHAGNLLINRLELIVEGAHSIARGGQEARPSDMDLFAESESPEVAAFLRRLAANMEETSKIIKIQPKHSHQPGGRMICCPGCDCGRLRDWATCSLCDGTGSVTQSEAQDWRDGVDDCPRCRRR